MYAFQVLQLVRGAAVAPQASQTSQASQASQTSQDTERPREEGLGSGAIKIRFKTQGGKYNT